VDMPGRHEIVECRETGKEFDVLKGPRDTQGCNPVGFQAGQVPVAIKDLSFIGVIEPVDAVKETGLSGPVGTDDGQDLCSLNIHGYIAQCLEPPEFEGEALNADGPFPLLSARGSWEGLSNSYGFIIPFLNISRAMPRVGFR